MRDDIKILGHFIRSVIRMYLGQCVQSGTKLKFPIVSQMCHTECTCLAADGLDLGLGVPLGELGAAPLEVVEAEVRAGVEGAAAAGKGGVAEVGGPLQEMGGEDGGQ